MNPLVKFRRAEVKVIVIDVAKVVLYIGVALGIVIQSLF